MITKFHIAYKLKHPQYYFCNPMVHEMPELKSYWVYFIVTNNHFFK